MFGSAFRHCEVPKLYHADFSPAMRSNALAEFLTSHYVTKSYKRPYVVNDNPYSESEFRTMKYSPNYPVIFQILDDYARAYLDNYARSYNTSHKHSGIALSAPQAVHDGTWRGTHRNRDLVHQRYYLEHSE